MYSSTSSNDHSQYFGWDNYGYEISDAGGFTHDGDLGDYVKSETWAGGYAYVANGG